MKKALCFLAMILVLSTSRTGSASAIKYDAMPLADISWHVSLDTKNVSYLYLTVDATKINHYYLIENIKCTVGYLNRSGAIIKKEQIPFILSANQNFVGGYSKTIHYHYSAQGTVSVQGLDMKYTLSPIGHEYDRKISSNRMHPERTLKAPIQ